MPVKNKTSPQKQKSFEETLWETANKLRGSVDSFVFTNGPATAGSTNTKGEGEIHQKLVENELVDNMIALLGQLFYTTQIPVCLWFLTKNKKADKTSNLNCSERLAA